MDNFGELMARIPSGHENAIKMPELAAGMHVTQRELRKMVQDARHAGHVIAGDRAGYYQPATLAEYRHCYLMTKMRALGTMAYLSAIKNGMTAAAMEEGSVEQVTLEEYVQGMEA